MSPSPASRRDRQLTWRLRSRGESELLNLQQQSLRRGDSSGRAAVDINFKIRSRSLHSDVDEVEFETSPFLVFDGLHYFEKRRVSHDAADEAREAPAPAATDESRSQGGPGDDRASLRAEPP